MATHEQTYLGPVFEQMQEEGLLEIAEEENSYGLAARFCQLAGEVGVVIDADPACPDCRESALPSAQKTDC